MCGRYVSVASAPRIAELLDIAMAVDDLPELAPNWNVAPTDQVFGVIERPGPGEERSRELHLFRWGLVPSWSRTPAGGARMINARVEGLTERPAYRSAAAKRRAITPLAGWYEWTSEVPAQGGRAVKQPHYLHAADGTEILYAAALYEWWRDPTKSEDDPARWLATITIVTTNTAEATPAAAVHDRTPVIIPARRLDEWLDPGQTDGAKAQQLLQSLEPPVLAVRDVGREVNRVGTNGAHLIEPLRGEQPLHLQLIV